MDGNSKLTYSVLLINPNDCLASICTSEEGIIRLQDCIVFCSPDVGVSFCVPLDFSFTWLLMPSMGNKQEKQIPALHLENYSITAVTLCLSVRVKLMNSNSSIECLQSSLLQGIFALSIHQEDLCSSFLMHCKCPTIFLIHSFIQALSIAPLQVHYYSEALLTQHGYCVGVLHWSATGNCEQRTSPRSLHGG